MTLIEPAIGTVIAAVVLALTAYFTGFASAHPFIAVIGILVLSPLLFVIVGSILISLIDFIDGRRLARRK
jgi:hypothetical protein